MQNTRLHQEVREVRQSDFNDTKLMNLLPKVVDGLSTDDFKDGRALRREITD